MNKKLSSLIVLLLVAQFFVPNFTFAETVSDVELSTCGEIADYTISIIEAKAEDNGVRLEWEKIDDPQFEGYKIVISKDNPNPVYGEDGYLVWITDPDTTSYLVYNAQKYNNGDFGDYLEPGEDYYFSITVVYECGLKVAGNAVKITFPDVLNDGDDDGLVNADDNEDMDTAELVADTTVVVDEFKKQKDNFKKFKIKNKEHKEKAEKELRKLKRKKDSDELKDIKNKVLLLRDDRLDDILSELKELRSIVREQQTQIKYLKSLSGDFEKITANMKTAIENFVTYGVDDNTKGLGEGERAAVIHSYKKAFGKLPSDDVELEDAIKIANGRWPSLRNKVAEDRGSAIFEGIYDRRPDLDNPNDNAAVTIMSYGLRQRAENRKLESEQNGLKIYQDIFDHLPETTEDWNVMQAITYSGATR